MTNNQLSVLTERIRESIFFIRDQNVILDFHLAKLYEIETDILTNIVQSNIDKFPKDFMFKLTREELNLISKNDVSQNYPSHAFTERGIVMLSSVFDGERIHYINIEIVRTFALQRETERVRHIQTAFSDFIHQLQGPLVQAALRAQRTKQLAKELSSSSIISRNLLAVSGLCNRAVKVAKNIRLFTDLARGLPLKLNLSRVYHNELIKLLIQMAADNEVMIEPTRGIKVDLLRKGFSVLKELIVEIDINLVEQALQNLLDNAVKYSFSNTKIKIYAKANRRQDRFHIIVMNRGISIHPHEVKLCIERNWRGEPASLVTGEGKGIGLWAVDSIMRAHKGQLVVAPTTEEGWTEVKLVFLAAKSEGNQTL